MTMVLKGSFAVDNIEDAIQISKLLDENGYLSSFDYSSEFQVKNFLKLGEVIKIYGKEEVKVEVVEEVKGEEYFLTEQICTKTRESFTESELVHCQCQWESVCECTNDCPMRLISDEDISSIRPVVKTIHYIGEM